MPAVKPSAARTLSLRLLIWRQAGPSLPGKMVEHRVTGVSTEVSFLEMLDVLNEDLIRRGQEPIAFDSDCREGICGSCGLVVNGRAHGPLQNTTICQVHMRSFRDGDTITIEPWRAKAFPIVKDLSIDRSAFDRIVQSGGYVSANVGGAPQANSVLVPKEMSDAAMDAAACIGCGACVAACKNASASLFTGAKIAHLAQMPQGGPERGRRAAQMVLQMDYEGFGTCSNEAECEAVCPKGISIAVIARMNREFVRAVFTG
jgi:succinate dehydrogenase / fumarate reductase iron-sulfur subunit